MSADHAASPMPRRVALTLVFLVLVEALSSFEHVMIISALPLLSRQFGLAQSGWTITAFLIVQAATAAIGARLGDLYGRRRVLACLLLLCGAGSVLSALSSSIGGVILGRCIQGFSGAILPLCFGIVRQIAPPGRVAFWIGALTGGYTLASAAGYVLGGHFADLGDWRLIFWFSGIYGLALFPLLLLVVPALPGHGAKAGPGIDWLGGILLALGVGMLVLAVSQVASGDPLRSLVALAAGAGLLLWWWRHELTHAAPLIEVRLLRLPPVLIANLCGAVAALGTLQLPIVVMQFLQQPPETGAGLGLSGTIAGLLKLPSNAAAMVAAIFAGWLCGRIGSRGVVQLGGVVVVIFWAGLALFHADQWQVLGWTIGAAFGSTMLLAAVPNLIIEHAPADRVSEATGMSAVVRGLFAAVGAQLVSSTLAFSATGGAAAAKAYPSMSGYVSVFLGIAASGLLIVVIARRRHSLTGVPTVADVPTR